MYVNSYGNKVIFASESLQDNHFNKIISTLVDCSSSKKAPKPVAVIISMICVTVTRTRSSPVKESHSSFKLETKFRETTSPGLS